MGRFCLCPVWVPSVQVDELIGAEEPMLDRFGSPERGTGTPWVREREGLVCYRIGSWLGWGFLVWKMNYGTGTGATVGLEMVRWWTKKLGKLGRQDEFLLLMSAGTEGFLNFEFSIWFSC
jgi:hypothetical protein